MLDDLLRAVPVMQRAPRPCARCSRSGRRPADRGARPAQCGAAARALRRATPGRHQDHDQRGQAAHHQVVGDEGDGRQHGQQQQADHVRQGEAAIDHGLVDAVAGQVERRAADQRGGGRHGVAAVRMQDDQFVGHGRDDHAGDQDHVHVVEPGADAARIVRMHDGLGAVMAAGVEIHPPHRGGAEEGGQQRDRPARASCPGRPAWRR